jgi:hypothetical protein
MRPRWSCPLRIFFCLKCLSPDTLFGPCLSSAAGSDTTAVTLRAFVYYMVKNPTVRKKLQEEIDEAVGRGQLDFPCKYADAVKLEYFQVWCLRQLR